MFYKFLSTILILTFLGLSLQNEKSVNVHLIVHSHDDVGWLKTADEYYKGTAFVWGQKCCVKCVLDEMFTALKKSKERTFNEVEMYFFKRWFRDLSSTDKLLVTQLVKNDQLYFLNAGVSMHDEAACYYEDMISQMTTGHEFLQNTFGVTPKIGWQIDPFGHSAANAFLYNKIGFDNWHFERTHYKEVERMRNQKAFQFLWFPTPDFPQFSQYNYFKYGRDQFGSEWEAKNLQNYFHTEASQHRTSHILHHIGDDFTIHTDGSYQKYEKIIKHYNENTDINMFFSTPQRYIDSVYKEAQEKNISIPIFQQDLFPYLEKEDSSWTGYFTTQPELKGIIRAGGKYLRSIEQLFSIMKLKSLGDIAAIYQVSNANGESFKGRNKASIQSCYEALEEAVGIGTHHDAVTGTAKNYVNEDYKRIFSTALSKCQSALQDNMHQAFNDIFTSNKFKFCNMQNSTQCKVEINKEYLDKEVMLVLFNPGQQREELFQFKLEEGLSVKIKRDKTEIEHSQICQKTQADPSSFCQVYFVDEFVANEFSFYFIEIKKQSTNKFEMKQLSQNNELKLDINSNKKIVVKSNWLNFHYQTKENSQDFELQYKYYNSHRSPQASGAYIMKIEGSSKSSLDSPNLLEYYQDKLITVIGLERGNSTYTTLVFINRNTEYFNQIFIKTLFQHPKTQPTNREYVLQVTQQNFNNENIFWTDSNGLMFEKRVKNNNNRIDTNYYPVNSAITIQDISQQKSMSLIPDRAEGGASIENGSIELMIQRLLNQDDQRGLGEGVTYNPLLELNHVLVFSSIKKHENILREIQLRQEQMQLSMIGSTNSSLYNSKLYYHTKVDKEIIGEYSLLKENIREINSTNFMYRIQNFGRQDQQLNQLNNQQPQDQQIYINMILGTSMNISKINQYTLTGNQLYSDWLKNRKHWNIETDIKSLKNNYDKSFSTNIDQYLLKYLDIKTFIFSITGEPSIIEEHLQTLKQGKNKNTTQQATQTNTTKEEKTPTNKTSEQLKETKQSNTTSTEEIQDTTKNTTSTLPGQNQNQQNITRQQKIENYIQQAKKIYAKRSCIKQ